MSDIERPILAWLLSANSAECAEVREVLGEAAIGTRHSLSGLPGAPGVCAALPWMDGGDAG